MARGPEGLDRLVLEFMRMKQKVVAATIAAVLVSWLVAALTPSSLVYGSGPEGLLPGLPLVSAPFVPNADVVSIVPYLYGAFMVAFVSIVLAEIAKVTLLKLGQRTLVAYCGFCLYQVFLGFDVLRRFAVDWYGYLLHFLRLAKLSGEVRFPDPLPIPPPFLSLIPLALLSLNLVLSLRGSLSPDDERRAGS